ncbi:MAG: ABC transporter ATP-binding protein [bacterium]
MSTQPIVIENLTKVYKGGLEAKDVLALKNLHCIIHKGEVFAFIGPNGAGKTTTIKLITRLIFPTKGKIFIFGQENTSHISMSRVGYLPEHPNIYGYLKGREFLDFVAKLFKQNINVRKSKISELIELVGLTDNADKLIKNYSRGMVQRLALAQALVNEPDILILDEPMSGLDPVGRKDFRDLIINLKSEGKTIFFSSHILSDAEMIADRVAMINKGQLIKIDTLDEIVYEQTSCVEITFSLSAEELSKLPINKNKVVRHGDTMLITVSGKDEVRESIEKIVGLKGEIISVIPRRNRLEDVFIKELGRK